MFIYYVLLKRGAKVVMRPSFPRNGCTLLKNGRCTIHNVCKPLEGRVASHDGKHDGVHQSVAALWDTDKGPIYCQAAWQQL